MSAQEYQSLVPAGGERIELSFPANVDLVVVARFTAATMAARANFGIDDLEDLRLAVDELCISLGPLSGDRTLRLVFERSDDAVEIVASFVTPAGATTIDSLPDHAIWQQGRELSARLLDSLVDEHGGEIRDGQRCTWLRKRPSGARS